MNENYTRELIFSGSSQLMNPYHDGSVVTTGFMTSYLTITGSLIVVIKALGGFVNISNKRSENENRSKC